MTDDRLKAPSGTVTFVFSDIEGSTQRWDENRQAMQAAVRRHDKFMRGAIENNGGYVFKTIGDAFCAAFGSADDALAATLQAQRTFAQEDWSAVGGLRVRMAIHTGIADERDDDYYGPTVNRVARLLAIGYGGQVLVSGAARSLIEERTLPHIRLIDLGVHRLKDLSTPEHVFQLGADGLASDFPALKSLDAIPNNLPAQLTALIGRDGEIAEIKTLVDAARLVTLVGAGGIGKTRTALQVAAEYARDDGAWFVDLASCENPELVASAVAAVFNIADDGSRPPLDLVAVALQTKKLVMVLDNCEQIVAGVAASVDRLLQACPDLRIIATSREPLGIVGEEIYRLPLLPVPPEGAYCSPGELMEYGAVALFVSRARAAQKMFDLNEQNGATVAEIVRRLDGIALAIELAAARVKVLNVAQLAQRLDDRLKLLTGGSRTALPRQQTLRALIGWSYDLLNDLEKGVLRQAAVLRGTWTLEAIEAVWGGEGAVDVLDAVAALVDKSLVVVDGSADENRYRLLESTREFALERLTESGELGAAATRHCTYFANLAAELDASFWRGDSDAWIARVRREIENYRAAISFGLETGELRETAAAIVINLRRFWWAVAPNEGRSLVADVQLRLPEVNSSRLRALLTLWQYTLTDSLAHAIGSIAQTERMLADLNDTEGRVEALIALSSAIGSAGDPLASAEAAGQAVTLARPLGLPHLLGSVLSSAAYRFAVAGDEAHANAFFDEADPIIRRCNDKPTLARLLVIRGEMLFAKEKVEEALVCAREAEAIYRERSSTTWLNVTLLNEASYYLAVRDLHDARNAAREALKLATRRHDAFSAAVAIGHLARVSSEIGDAERAARLTGFVDAVYARIRSVREPTEQRGYERTRELLEASISEERITALLKDGASMEQKHAEEEALSIELPLEAAG